MSSKIRLLVIAISTGLALTLAAVATPRADGVSSDDAEEERIVPAVSYVPTVDFY